LERLLQKLWLPILLTYWSWILSSAPYGGGPRLDLSGVVPDEKIGVYAYVKLSSLFTILRRNLKLDG
jgi:hypothetical protein